LALKVQLVFKVKPDHRVAQLAQLALKVKPALPDRKVTPEIRVRLAQLALKVKPALPDRKVTPEIRVRLA
jgi:hypothetical protein